MIGEKVKESCVTTEEIWKDVYPVEKYEGYQISNIGNVRCCRDYHKGYKKEYKIITPHADKDGYLYISVSDKNTTPRKRTNRRIHRMVAEAFLGPQPGMVINHIDGNKTNNIVSNLEWVTAEENSTLAAKAGLYKTQPVRIIETGEVFSSIRDCGEAIDYHPCDITRCISGKKKSIRGLHFENLSKEEYDIIAKEKTKSKPFLYDYQLDAVNRLRNGSILCGSVGSGKSRTGLFYYFKENGGWIDEYGYKPMNHKPKDLYIISTAKKRDDGEWSRELANFMLSTDPKHNMFYGNKIIIDSWNNLPKYKDVEGAFFLLDEQRLVSYGAWTKAFLKIAKTNDWILLTATPADTYLDYLPVFLANGFFTNKTEFNREHVVFSRFTKYPKIEKYINTTRLDRLRDRILVQMNYKHEINTHHEDIYCNYDVTLYKNTIRNRWDYYKNEPIGQASGLCHTLRRIVNTDEYRQVKLLELLEDIPRAIIFYNFNYERDILLNLGYSKNTEVAEWSGNAHQPIPKGDRWVYLVQYTAGCEGWECVKTNVIIFYSQNYSYKVMTQAAGRIDRLNTPYDNLYYYHLKSRAGIDLAISKALAQKKKFNERKFVKWD